MKFSSGWHIPSIEEWNRMFDAFGGTKYGFPGDNLYNSTESHHWDSGNVRQAMLDAGGNAFWRFSNFAAKTTFNGEVGFWVYSFEGRISDEEPGYWAWRTRCLSSCRSSLFCVLKSQPAICGCYLVYHQRYKSV